MMRDSEAILQLLDDPDPVVRGNLAARLSADRELLDRTWALARLRDEPPAMLCDLVLASDAPALVARYAEAGLEEGCWLLPLVEEPRRDHATSGRAALDGLAARLGADCDGSDVAQFLCGACGFAGDGEDYDHPDNSLLPRVLERRLGLPIALTVLWMLVGQRRGVTLHALALPGHVIGRCRRRRRGAVTYIDLFAGGDELALSDVVERLRQSGMADQPSMEGAERAPAWVQDHLAPADERTLLRRMARNLAASYARRGDRLRATVAGAMARA